MEATCEYCGNRMSKDKDEDSICRKCFEKWERGITLQQFEAYQETTTPTLEETIQPVK